MKKSINILIVEDEPIIADDINFYLESNGYLNNSIVHTYSDANEVLNTGDVDFVFLDYNLRSTKTGLDLAKEINQSHLLPFAFITSHADKDSIQQIKVLHPVGYIVKPFNGKDIPAVLELGLELFYSYMDSRTEFDFGKLRKFINTDVTAQEKNVILKLIEGKSNKQISEELFISLNTVKTHLKSIFLKLEVNSRTEAMFFLSKCASK